MGKGWRVGMDGREWPWGDDFEQGEANIGESDIDQTSAVGLFARDRSPYGLLDCAGNVWEWCATKWQNSYQNYADDNDLSGGSARVFRGGSWDNVASRRAAYVPWQEHSCDRTRQSGVSLRPPVL